MSELRINGFETVHLILSDLAPYVRFKKLQVEAMIEACRILEHGVHTLSNEQIVAVIDLALLTQRENYATHHKKDRDELLRAFGLTP